MSGIVTRRTYAEIRSKKMAGNGPAAENTISERLLSPYGSGSDPSYCCGSIPDMACGKAENGESSYAAVIDESLDEKKLAQVTADMSNLLGADGKRKTVQIDVVILDRELFEEYAGYGYFESLDEVTEEDLEKKYGESYQYAAGYKEDDEVSFEDHETGQGEVKPYGISLSGDNRFTEMSEYIKDPVFAVAIGTKNPENALKFLEYLMEE